jgi:hypothetical protein
MTQGPLYEPLAREHRTNAVWEGRKRLAVNALYLLGTLAVMAAAVWALAILAIAFKP